MASRTSTETKREISRRGNSITIKTIEKTTTHVDGKEPEVKEVTKVEVFEGEEGYKRLPEDVRRTLEKPDEEKSVKPLNKNATRGNFAEDCLAEHNRYRKLHSVNPLKLSQQLIKVSEERAKELAEKDEMSSRSDHTYGENLTCLWSSDPDHYVQASEIVSRWYSEEKNYNYDVEPENLNAGHFTQMIWAGCKEFGVAAAKSDSNKIYVVATYSPPGNYVGEFKKNVLRSGSKGTNAKGFLGLKLFSSSKMETKPKGSATAAQSIDALNKDSVNCHNEYRKKHGAPPLTYSSALAQYAQEWAEELARRDRMEHRKERKYGENIYCFKSTNPQAVASAADACSSWYSEIKDYDFNSEPKSLATGHFTQMVWKTTEEVGMGRAKSNTGLQIIVANYNPPGNYVGNYRQNVLKPI